MRRRPRAEGVMVRQGPDRHALCAAETPSSTSLALRASY
jgi:hypothetical protein